MKQLVAWCAFVLLLVILIVDVGVGDDSVHEGPKHESTLAVAL